MMTKTSKRAKRRADAKRVRIAQQKRLAKRTKGLWLWDDPECFTCIVKRNDREQHGRLRLLKGHVDGANRRQKLDKARPVA